MNTLNTSKIILLKLMLHRASMKEYQDLLKKFTVKYIEAAQKFTFKGDFVIFDPIDKIKVESDDHEISKLPFDNESMETKKKSVNSSSFVCIWW